VSKLKGGNDLRNRLKALKLAFKPIGRQWGRNTVKAGRPMVPIQTGRLRKSLRVTSASQKKARVGGHYTGYFIDAGVKPHTIKPKGSGSLVFRGRHGTIFAKKVNHRGFRARPFRKRMAQEGLRQTPMAQTLIDQWNDAA
jgi:hypothetical protein